MNKKELVTGLKRALGLAGAAAMWTAAHVLLAAALLPGGVQAAS